APYRGVQQLIKFVRQCSTLCRARRPGGGPRPRAVIVGAAVFLLLGQFAGAQSGSPSSPPLGSAQQAPPRPAPMFALGGTYYRGRGVPIDWGAAAYWYAEAAERRQAEAMTRLAVMYWRGEAVAYDKAKALDLLRGATELGHTAALTELGALYLEGDLVERNLRIALRYFRSAAERGDPAGMILLARALAAGWRGARNEEAARNWSVRAQQAYRQRAEAGDVTAMISLAGMYQSGSE